MKQPLVSIICPMYNCEKFVFETINSVLKQNYDNFELIIVDDCSSDKTKESVLSFKEPRIKYFRNKTNSGAAYSRNFALKIASGDYVAFLDADDIWYESKLQKQIEFMISNNFLFTYTDYEVVDEKGNKTGIYYTGPSIVKYKNFKRIDYIGTSTVIFKKSVFPDLQIPNDILKRNDDALWLLLSSKTDCYRMKGIYSGYRKVEGSISSGSKFKLIKYHIILYKKLYNFSGLRAFFWSIRNIIWYFIKQIVYRKKAR